MRKSRGCWYRSSGLEALNRKDGVDLVFWWLVGDRICRSRAFMRRRNSKEKNQGEERKIPLLDLTPISNLGEDLKSTSM